MRTSKAGWLWVLLLTTWPTTVHAFDGSASPASSPSQASASAGIGLDFMFVTGDSAANSGLSPYGGALDLSLRLEPINPLGRDLAGSDWRFVTGPRLRLADAGVASIGSLGILFGLRSTDVTGKCPEFAILGGVGAVLENDRSSRGVGLLFGIDMSVGVSLGWRLTSTTRVMIDAGIGGVIASHRETFFVGPVGLSYGASW